MRISPSKPEPGNKLRRTHRKLSNRPTPNQSDPLRPSTATENATRSCQADVTTDPDLAAVVTAWSDLPDAIKAGIVAMVRTASDRKVR